MKFEYKYKLYNTIFFKIVNETLDLLRKKEEGKKQLPKRLL